MFIYPEIDPVAIELGPVAVRWYGLMYVIGILGLITVTLVGTVRAGKIDRASKSW